MPPPPLRDRIGRRFSRFATRVVIARPGLWRLFRGSMRAQFDRLAESWDSRVGPEGLTPLRTALGRIPQPRSVLDLGTGSGKAARLAAECFPAAIVTGVDLSPAMIEQARALLPPELVDRVRFEVADAAALPFESASFELVVLLNMIPFFPELARVTAEGGAVVICFSFGAATPIYVPPETLEDRLRAAGFGSFEEIEVGPGTAVVARKASPTP